MVPLLVSPLPTMSVPLPEIKPPALFVKLWMDSRNPPYRYIWPEFDVPAGENERLTGLGANLPADVIDDGFGNLPVAPYDACVADRPCPIKRGRASAQYDFAAVGESLWDIESAGLDDQRSCIVAKRAGNRAVPADYAPGAIIERGGARDDAAGEIDGACFASVPPVSRSCSPDGTAMLPAFEFAPVLARVSCRRLS